MELSDVPNSEQLVPYFLPHQLFYFGDIPRAYISAVYLDQPREDKRDEDIGRLVAASVPKEIIRIHDRFKKNLDEEKPEKYEDKDK